MNQSLLGKRTRDGEPLTPNTPEENLSPTKVNTVKTQSTLSSFISGAPKRMLYKRNEWHPDSLWRDLSIEPSLLEDKQSIFDIIMPWVDELRQEEAAK